MTTSEQINEIATACAKAQAALRPAVKDASNPAFKSKYADLASIVEASKVYAAQGVAVFQDATTSEAGAAVVTRLVHTSGQWLEFGPFTVPTAKKDAHGIGSATTYEKRYALASALGIASDEDDDGNAAAAKHTSPATAVSAPAGFADWLADLEAVAAEGTASLQDAWRSSAAEMRGHLTAQQPKVWESIKAKAAKVQVAA